MAFDIPTSLIRQVQSALREEAGLSSYDPDDPSLPNLRSIEESLAVFDPSPPYLRCKQCRGRLIRDLQSIVCIYCGAQQRKELPPEPLPFKTTFGYRWLLESLDLNGSETVDLSAGLNGSTKSHNVAKEELVLSDLLDIKLDWLAEPEKIESSFTNEASIPNKSSLNFAGVDFDNFFSATKNEDVPNGSKEDFVSNEKMNKETETFLGLGSLNLFENVQSSEEAPRPVTTVGDGDPFSDWTAEFQSASSGNFPGDSKFDPFLGSSIISASATESTFALEKDVTVNLKNDGSGVDVKVTNDSFPLTSKSDDWVQGNLWGTSGTEISGRMEQFEMNNKTNHVEPKTNLNNLSSNGESWFEDDLWQNSSMKVAESKKINEDDDSDVWHDFTSSGNMPDLFSNLSTTSGSAVINSEAQASGKSMADLSNNSNETDFFSFSGVSSVKNPLTEVNDLQLEPSIPSRMVDMDNHTGADAKAGSSIDGNSTTTIQSEVADPAVEMLMKEMPDLSFMLEKDLKIPPK